MSEGKGIRKQYTLTQGGMQKLTYISEGGELPTFIEVGG